MVKMINLIWWYLFEENDSYMDGNVLTSLYDYIMSKFSLTECIFFVGLETCCYQPPPPPPVVVGSVTDCDQWLLL